MRWAIGIVFSLLSVGYVSLLADFKVGPNSAAGKLEARAASYSKDKTIIDYYFMSPGRRMFNAYEWDTGGIILRLVDPYQSQLDIGGSVTGKGVSYQIRLRTGKRIETVYFDLDGDGVIDALRRTANEDDMETRIVFQGAFILVKSPVWVDPLPREGRAEGIKGEHYQFQNGAWAAVR